MSKDSANYSELPHMIKPMLAKARSEPFNSDKHLFEVKWDGTRCISIIEDGRLRLQNHHLIVCLLFKTQSLEIQQFCGGTVPALRLCWALMAAKFSDIREDLSFQTSSSDSKNGLLEFFIISSFFLTALLTVGYVPEKQKRFLCGTLITIS